MEKNLFIHVAYEWILNQEGSKLNSTMACLGLQHKGIQTSKRTQNKGHFCWHQLNFNVD